MYPFILFILSVMAYIWSRGNAMNFHELSPVVRTHLKRVYLCLTCALLASAIGAYLHVLYNIAGIFTSVASIAVATWFFLTPPDQEPKRICLLVVASLFGGASVSPLIELANYIDPGAAITALAGSVWAFTFIYAAAVELFRRGGRQYLGWFFTIGISCLLYLRFASMILGGSAATLELRLKCGLLVLYSYSLLAAESIIDRADHGDLGYVKHAVILFSAFTCLFFWILLVTVFEKSRMRLSSGQIED